MPSSKERFKCKASIKNKQSKHEGNSNLNEALSISSCSIGSDLFNNSVCDEEYHKKWRADYSTNSESNGNTSSNASSKRSRLPGVLNILNPQKRSLGMGKFVEHKLFTGKESSAQTLPYLPGISNDPQSILDMELFKLPTILPGDGPPGLYEVEVLERARKRWTFLKALKEKVRHQKQAMRERAQKIIPKHILMAFEWEHWIEREEYIEECQMIRLEILVRMFNKRESSMHSASNKRIQASYERIQNDKKAALRKNKIEHDRAMRRLNIKHSKESRVWRKENVSYDLDKPSSEYYAPKMRYGVNPNRRHYKALRKDFDIRMEDLEKQIVKIDSKHLNCPLAKIKALSKPKEVLSEHERNFCSDVNLKKIYEGLRLLRKTTGQGDQDTEYRVLRPGDSDEGVDDDITDEKKSLKDNIDAIKSDVALSSEVAATPPYQREEEATLERMYEEAEQMHFVEELKREKELNKMNIEKLNMELLREEKENILHAYEGNTIGWLMRFLREEMERAQQQRRLHFYYMLAQRERWRREALEAGLRQKENCLRSHYEALYKQCSVTNTDVAESYINEIIHEDIMCHADQEAEKHVVKLAKQIDRDVEGWLECFKVYQDPLNYDIIRCNLRRHIMADLSETQCREESNKVVDYIIEEILSAIVFAKLDTRDICTVTTEEFIDRLLDTDLYYESTESSSRGENRLAEQEASSIMRKLVRYAVPGRRYLTPSERTAANNVDDILDVVLGKLNNYTSVEQTEPIVMKSMTSLSLIGTNFPAKKSHSTSSISQGRLNESKTVSSHGDVETDVNFTRELKPEEELLLEDPDKISLDRTIVNLINYGISSDKIEDFKTIPIAREIPSTHDLQLYETFSDIPTHTYVEHIEPGRVSEVVVELYRFLSVKADDNDIEEEEKSIEEDERIREEEYTEDEESQNDKATAAEEHRETLHLDERQRKSKIPTERIEASFLLHPSSGLTRISRKHQSVYGESVTVKEPTLLAKDRSSLAEDIKKKASVVKFSR
uniref:Cilia- and flagella-associated protein 91 n=1 Tax=Glossina morsitans morsitans TaxID=37546 RepID=A0A1B0FDD9_GLOMM